MILENHGRAFVAGLVISMLFLLSTEGLTATNLKLNPNLDYSSDSNDGPLITGDEMSSGLITKGRPTYVIFYHRECYNSKRQARRTVDLYEKYKGRVDFVVVDLDSQISGEQKRLRDRHYRNYIPHVTIIGKRGEVVYDRSGEISTERVSGILDGLL